MNKNNNDERWPEHGIVAQLRRERDALLAFKKHAIATIGQYDKAHMKCKAQRDALLGLVRAFNITYPDSVYRNKADAAIAAAEKGGDMMSDGSPVKDTWEERQAAQDYPKGA